MIQELIEFKLFDNVDENLFLHHIEEINVRIKKFPGFLSRKLVRGNDGIWIELTEWETLDQAVQAGQAVFSEGWKVFQYIDPHSVKIQHLEIIKITNK